MAHELLRERTHGNPCESRGLRHCSLVVSSRYHALVCSMPGLVPSVGVTMDERIENLMADRGQPELALHVDDPDLDGALFAAMSQVARSTDEVQDAIGRSVVDQLERMGGMGRTLEAHVREHHPDFPFPERGDDALAYLPPLGPTTTRLAERYR